MLKSTKPCLSLLHWLMLTLLIQTLNASDWPCWRGPNKNGTTANANWNPQALEESSNILWRAPVGAGYGTAIVKGNRVFTFGEVRKEHDRVTCLNAETGQLLWKSEYKCPCPNGCFECYLGPRTTPVWDEGRLYTLSHQGQLHCWNAEDGALIWKTDLDREHGAEWPKYGYSGSPVIDGDILLLNARSGGLALNKNSGQCIWTTPKGRGSYSTPVIFNRTGKKAVLLFGRKRVLCRDLKSGKKLWQFDWPYVNNDGAASTDPVVVGSRVFISSAYRKGGGVIDFTDNRPKQIWFNTDIQTEFGTAIYNDGLLFAPHGDTRHPTSYLKCVDFKTGDILWSHDTGHCSLIQVNDKLILLNQWGKVSILKATRQGWTELAQTQIFKKDRKVRCWSAPVFADGKLFLKNAAGSLVCINLKRE